jgi:hypothetical protein
VFPINASYILRRFAVSVINDDIGWEIVFVSNNAYIVACCFDRTERFGYLVRLCKISSYGPRGD